MTLLDIIKGKEKNYWNLEDRLDQLKNSYKSEDFGNLSKILSELKYSVNKGSLKKAIKNENRKIDKENISSLISDIEKYRTSKYNFNIKDNLLVNDISKIYENKLEGNNFHFLKDRYNAINEKIDQLNYNEISLKDIDSLNYILTSMEKDSYLKKKCSNDKDFAGLKNKVEGKIKNLVNKFEEKDKSNKPKSFKNKLYTTALAGLFSILPTYTTNPYGSAVIETHSKEFNNEINKKNFLENILSNSLQYDDINSLTDSIYNNFNQNDLLQLKDLNYERNNPLKNRLVALTKSGEEISRDRFNGRNSLRNLANLLDVNIGSIARGEERINFFNNYNQVIEDAASKYNISSDLLKAVAIVESGGRKFTISRTGALGPFGLVNIKYNSQSPWSDGEVRESINPFDINEASDRAADFLNLLLNKYKHEGIALIAYNQGERVVDNNIKNARQQGIRLKNDLYDYLINESSLSNEAKTYNNKIQFAFNDLKIMKNTYFVSRDELAYKD